MSFGYINSMIKIEKNKDCERNNLIRGYNFFNNIFNPILNLEHYDKIGIIDNVEYKEHKFIDVSKINFGFYLDKYNIYQSITRWYYNQKREYIFSKIDILFEEYNNYLKLVQNNYSSLKFLVNKIIELNGLLINKLTLLNKTYNDNMVTDKINNYNFILLRMMTR